MAVREVAVKLAGLVVSEGKGKEGGGTHSRKLKKGLNLRSMFPPGLRLSPSWDKGDIS